MIVRTRSSPRRGMKPAAMAFSLDPGPVFVSGREYQSSIHSGYLLPQGIIKHARCRASQGPEFSPLYMWATSDAAMDRCASCSTAMISRDARPA